MAIIITKLAGGDVKIEGVQSVPHYIPNAVSVTEVVGNPANGEIAFYFSDQRYDYKFLYSNLTSINGTKTTFDADVARLSSDVFHVASSGGGGGDASAANQVTANTRLTEIRDKIIAAPATEAKQDTGNTSLSSIDGKVATAANQATGNGTLTSILAKIIAAPATEATLAAASAKLPATLGQKTKSASLAVTMASDQLPLNNKTSTAVTVAVTSTQLVAANAAGQRVIISVPSTAAISVWITFGTAAVLAPPSLELTAGGSYQSQDGFPDIQAINAIAAANTNVTVIVY